MDIAQEQEIAAIELHMERAQEYIAQADALTRLRANPDFKLVIEEGYFEKNAIRLVGLKAAGPMQSPEKQAAILRAMDGIGELQQHFQTLMVLASQAEQAIDDSRAELEAIENDENEVAA